MIKRITRKELFTTEIYMFWIIGILLFLDVVVTTRAYIVDPSVVLRSQSLLFILGFGSPGLLLVFAFKKGFSDSIILIRSLLFFLFFFIQQLLCAAMLAGFFVCSLYETTTLFDMIIDKGPKITWFLIAVVVVALALLIKIEFADKRFFRAFRKFYYNME